MRRNDDLQDEIRTLRADSQMGSEYEPGKGEMQYSTHSMRAPFTSKELGRKLKKNMSEVVMTGRSGEPFEVVSEDSAEIEPSMTDEERSL